ncbi:hypothetical protein RJ641_006787 [Dillenia turbinata]|uniref:Uncharacterized protein n=1 Tax=Dillenia turbinata TaxID=194707 RepID=A0AAN8VE53_9MAGN
MAKFVALLLLALVSISLLQTLVLAAKGQYHPDRSGYGPGSLKSYRKIEPPLSLSLPPNAVGLGLDLRSHQSNINARHNARGGAVGHSITSHACSSVRNAARNACACLQGTMGIKLSALATTTGRPREVVPNALEDV